MDSNQISYLIDIASELSKLNEAIRVIIKEQYKIDMEDKK